MDKHFREAPFADNIPVLLGLTGVWNTTFLGYSSMAILPYTQALSKLAPHIQQARLCEQCPSRPRCVKSLIGLIAHVCAPIWTATMLCNALQAWVSCRQDLCNC